MPFDSPTHLSKHFRHLLKIEGIKARCFVTSSNGVRIAPPAYGVEFSEDEQRTIRTMAVNNRLTLVRGLPIDIERMTDPHGAEFYSADY